MIAALDLQRLFAASCNVVVVSVGHKQRIVSLVLSQKLSGGEAHFSYLSLLFSSCSSVHMQGQKKM